MSALICKMCSAPLGIIDGGKFAKCTYCGTVFTLPLDDMNDELMKKALPLLERAEIFLKDGDYRKAGDYYDRVLDILPSSGEAYLGKGLAELQLRKINDLEGVKRQARNNYFIKKALVFCEEPQLSELMKILGIDHKTERSSRYIRLWRPEVLSIRKRFVRALREKMADQCPEYDKKAKAVTAGISEDRSRIKTKIDKLDAQILSNKNKTTDNMTYEQVYAMSDVVNDLLKQKRELQKQLSELDNVLNSKLDKLAAEFPDRRQYITESEFMEMAADYPLPPLPDELDESIVDKINDVILSSYKYLSLDDLCEEKHLCDVTRRRIEASLRKLIFDKHIISVSVDGSDYYAAIDLEGIHVE